MVGVSTGETDVQQQLVTALQLALVPRVRRLASTRVRPCLVDIWGNVKVIVAEPHKIVSVLAGATLAQLVIILSLGASLHAVGQHASIATLITVNTLAAIIGGAVPVPGGLPPIWGWLTLAWMRRREYI